MSQFLISQSLQKLLQCLLSVLILYQLLNDLLHITEQAIRFLELEHTDTLAKNF